MVSVILVKRKTICWDVSADRLLVSSPNTGLVTGLVTVHCTCDKIQHAWLTIRSLHWNVRIGKVLGAILTREAKCI